MNEKETFVFVTANKDRQEAIKAAIEKDTDSSWVKPSAENRFTDWNQMESEFDRCGYIVIGDLNDIPGTCQEIAEKLFRCFRRRITVCPLNEEQEKVLSKEQKDCWNLSESELNAVEVRKRLTLETLCKGGWKDVDTTEE